MFSLRERAARGYVLSLFCFCVLVLFLLARGSSLARPRVVLSREKYVCFPCAGGSALCLCLARCAFITMSIVLDAK